VCTGFPTIDQKTFAANPTSGTQGPPINYVLAQYVLNHVTDNTFNDVNKAFSPAQSMSVALTTDPSILKMTQSSASAIQGPNVILSVNEPCYLNIGAMGSQNQSSQRMSFYVFNYSDFLAAQSPVAFGTTLSYQTSGSKTYLPARPYFVDELYDTAQFSALGRSILIDNTTVSSLLGPTEKLLTFSIADPVIVIFAYASTSAALVNTIPVGRSTYSNFLENSFSGVYYTTGPTVSYCLKATLPPDGALYAFYGLSNTKANDSIASNNTGTGTSGNLVAQPRKVITDFNGSTNDCLGLDIRQVYPATALTINSTENNSGYTITGPAITGTFRTVSLASPNWANATAPVTQQFLPLAGTFIQDLDSGQPFSAAQLLPNYEALSLMAEWRPKTTSNEPSYQMFAVDRSVVQVPDVPTNQNPFALTNLDMMRPSTKFVKMCDVWRNTLRTSVVVPKEWSQSSNFDGSGILVSLMDCMGPEMYNATDSINNDYFGMCNGTLVSQGVFNSVSQPSVPGLVPSYTAPDRTGGSPGTTPWTVNGKVWSPFTGGSYWNTFDPNSAADSGSTDPVHFRFSPQLWFPTYGWVLGTQDVNNVWPTSIATNDNLLINNQAVFSSTDGSIRKMTLGSASTQSVVSEITGPNTFFNSGINLTGINFVESFVNPGRIYNLTYWSDNWWFTADTASVWTTAPTPSGIVLCDPIFIDQFFTPGIRFRPLSVDEGHPEKWSNTSWPRDEAHRFNVMKVIQYEGAEALFVSSIDGEYMILTRNGTTFTSVVNNESSANLFLPSGPSGPSGASGSLYISDILLSGPNIVVGSLPLPIDPQINNVPWADAGLPLLSLGHTPSNANGPVLLLQNQNWTLPLEDSNVIKSTFALPPFDPTADPVDFVTAYADSITPLQTPDGLGLRRIQRPANVKPSDAIMPFLGGLLQNNDIAVASLLKGYDSGPVINFAMDYTTNVLQSAGVPTFYAAGFDMDLISKAYFSIDGLGPIINEKSLGLHVIDSTQRNVTIESKIAPMFTNSMAFSIKTTPFSPNRLTSEFIHPTNGPLSEYAKELNDYASLNIFQNMNVKRTSPVQSNQIITDISYAEELNGLAWTTFGPFGAEGVTMASLNNGITTLVPKDPVFRDAHFLTQNTVLEWNPYELKWYCAGLANNMYDFGSLAEPDPLLRPSGISVADYAKLVWDPATRAFTNNNARLMLVYADASSGLSDAAGAVKFQQVYKLLNFNEGNYIVRPLSRDFDSISCMGFSPSAVVIGGSSNGLARIAHKTGTSIASNDLKAAWALTDLNVAGSVTAIKYVGYAWYITTWDPVLLRSSLFFASLTFAGITSIDSWNTNSTLEVTALSAVLPPTTTCTDGYEPDPNNPAVCIKKCPANFETYGTLCVQICPAPFSATGIVNECQPDSKMPNVTVPLARGAPPPVSDLKVGPCVGPSCASPESINWPVMVLSIALTLLVLAFLFGIVNALRSR
jgi:hypothetical protein